MYTGYQPIEYFGERMGYKRIDDLLLLMMVDKGTPNVVLEDDNEGVDDGGNALKTNPRIQISVLIVDIHSQYHYTLIYYNVWVAKQKAMEKYVVLKFFFMATVLGIGSVLTRFLTDLKMRQYYIDQLVPQK
ncbi:hypothetical protein PVK06_024764 [Gossypium arboreum]|uniref:Uncharacterized protein n=1 Tax=Gossypium arboreum TaxID=29729 RepID=A0ABR0PEL3_GOSAR|nr:hypothetical protein PVK06_024764 [Gossypium arboreum]